MSDQTRRPEPPLHVIASAGAGDARGPASAPAPGPGEEPTPLRSYVDIILDARRQILFTVLAAAVIGCLHLARSTPLYASDAVVQVEDRAKPVGSLDELASIFDTKSAADTEIELLRSRSVVGAVVDELHLDVRAEPRYFPVVGAAIARLRPRSVASRAPAMGLGPYAWGGENVRVDRFEVPRDLEGRAFTLIARRSAQFDLLAPDGKVVLHGDVGQPAKAALGEAHPTQFVRIFVSELTARPGTPFRVEKLSRADVIDDLRKRLVIAERGRKTGVILLALEGPDPALVAATLDGIARTYLRLNVEKKSAEAAKTLEFVNSQLPRLRSSVEGSELALNEYRSKHGSVDVSRDTQRVLERLATLEGEYTTIELQASEAKQRFTPNHPVMAATLQKLARLKAERDELDARLRRLPRAELESARLTRDVKVTSELYVLLLNKAQELAVVKNGTVGNVHIVDAALVPQRPSSPKPGETLGVSLLLGTVVGLGVAFARKSLLEAVDDPEVIEREIGLPIYASIPHSPAEAALSRARRKKGGGVVPILAAAEPTDLAVEAMRSLRTSAQFALAEARNNVVTIAGPSPGIGKSFVAAHLAHVMGDAGARVLLVDGDMRKGHLHHYFGCDKAPGLSDIIRGTATEQAAIRRTRAGAGSGDFLPMGEVPPNPSELLSSARFQEFIEKASHGYDVVLIDTAPILAVTDAVLTGRLAGTNLIVLRAGQHPLREIALAVKRLTQNGVRAHALILNDVMPRAAGSSYPKYGAQYEYR